MSDIDRSRHIAGLIGPTLVVLSITEYLHFEIWEDQIPSLVYLNGTLLFIGGLSVLRAHWVWKGWPRAVTLMGCLALLMGFLRMLFPFAKQAVWGPPP